ncbi:MAG: hypothetical protein AAGD92_10805 [Pseudomonadota bacterium]
MSHAPVINNPAAAFHPFSPYSQPIVIDCGKFVDDGRFVTYY